MQVENKGKTDFSAQDSFVVLLGLKCLLYLVKQMYKYGELLSKAQRIMCHSRSIDITRVWRNMNYLMQEGKPGNIRIQEMWWVCKEKNAALKDISDRKIDIMIKY